MLPAPHRLRSSADFGLAVRRGRRAGTATLVVHVLAASSLVEGPPRVGLVVSKAVGGAVVRNRTKRRLRAIVRTLLHLAAPGALLVVRANPAAAGASTAQLERDLRSALARAASAARPRGAQ